MNLAKSRSQEFFVKKKISSSILEAFYNNLVKFNKDKETNEISKKYPPKFRIKIPPNCVIFDEKTKERINLTDTTFDEVIQAGCQVKLLFIVRVFGFLIKILFVLGMLKCYLLLDQINLILIVFLMKVMMKKIMMD